MSPSTNPSSRVIFPEEPVMPGVLQVEAMAQAAGVLVLNYPEEPEKYSTYFLKIDKCKVPSEGCSRQYAAAQCVADD